MLVHRRVTPGGTHLYTWVERGTVECLAQEHNTVSPGDQGSNQDRSMQDERTDHESAFYSQNFC